jgi:hypothetical protein
MRAPQLLEALAGQVRSTAVLLALVCSAVLATSAWADGPGFALRFFGQGVMAPDQDRVKIPLEDRPVNVGATDLTIEWWMRAHAAENSASAEPCTPGEDNWITGNIIFDRDVFGRGDFGDYGISLRGGRLAVGAHNGAGGIGICGATDVADGAWHHVAVTRRVSNGLLQTFIDGQLDGVGFGAGGNISYNRGRPTNLPNSDPFLVIGAEKHDAGSQFPSFSGWIDEVRLSTIIRYADNFARPSRPFKPDRWTAALYHFDEGAGDHIADSSRANGGPSHGFLQVGGPPQGPLGPLWVASDAPLSVPDRPPVADAGPGKVVRVGRFVALDGSASFDPNPGPNPLSFRWTQMAGPRVSLAGATTAMPTFNPGRPGIYLFTLVVHDGLAASRPDRVKVRVLRPHDDDDDDDD